MNRSMVSIIILAFTVTLCLPSWSLGRRGGTEDGHEPGHHHGNWAVPDQEERRVNPVPADRASLEEGAKLYKTYCAVCHGEKAKGDGPAGANLTPRPPDLTHEAGHDSDGELAWKIATGRPPMPAWKGTLTETQIWHVVNYLKNISAPRARGGRDDGGRRR